MPSDRKFSRVPVLRLGLWALIGVSAAGVVAWANPFLPATAQVNETVQSLAGLDRVQLRILRPAPDLEATGVTAQFIHFRLKQLLKKAGVEIVRDEDAPILLFQSSILSEPRTPDALTYVHVIQILQKVRVHRFARDLRVPTYFFNSTGLERREDFAEAAMANVDPVIETFLRDLGLATGGSRLAVR